MVQYINFNGEHIPESERVLTVSNRAFRYGDGFFETIRCSAGQPLWLDFHMKRIKRSLKVLKMKLPSDVTLSVLEKQLHALLLKNNHKDARIRLSFFRDADGYYRPDSDQLSYLIQSVDYPGSLYQLNKKGLHVGVFPDLKKPYNELGAVKSCNALLYVMACIYAREQLWDDIFIFNTEDNLAEASSSNLFMVKDNVVFTPAEDQACVMGVMRDVLIPLLIRNGLKVVECALTKKDLLEADELFLSNTIHGVQWVKAFENKRYYHTTSGKIIELLNREVSERSL